MTRRDYILLQNTLNITLAVNTAIEDRGAIRGVEQAVHGIANALKEDNKAFDREQFIKNVKGEK